MNIQRLEQMIGDLKARLGGGLLATDVWERDSRQVLAAMNSQPAAVDLIGTVATQTDSALRSANFPGLDRYMVMSLEGDKAVVVVFHGTDIVQGLLLDTRATNMGIALSIGLRTAEDGVTAARQG